jgi:hypothetical protein
MSCVLQQPRGRLSFVCPCTHTRYTASHARLALRRATRRTHAKLYLTPREVSEVPTQCNQCCYSSGSPADTGSCFLRHALLTSTALPLPHTSLWHPACTPTNAARAPAPPLHQPRRPTGATPIIIFVSPRWSCQPGRTASSRCCCPGWGSGCACRRQPPPPLPQQPPRSTPSSARCWQARAGARSLQRQRLLLLLRRQLPLLLPLLLPCPPVTADQRPRPGRRHAAAR